MPAFDFKKDPFENFLNSIVRAEDRKEIEHQAMALSTVSDNKPSTRIVYFKGLIRGGFSFYTNSQSQKGRDIETHKQVSALFFWPKAFEQVHIQGEASKLTDAESDQYFLTRPRLSQLGAWASRQSEEIKDYNILVEQLKFYEEKFKGQKIQRPPYWNGYHIIPNAIEFWFGREGRLHERYIYEKCNQNLSWRRFMKSP